MIIHDKQQAGTTEDASLQLELLQSVLCARSQVQIMTLRRGRCVWCAGFAGSEGQSTSFHLPEARVAR